MRDTTAASSGCIRSQGSCAGRLSRRRSRGRRHAPPNFAEKRERQEGNDEASLRRVHRVSAQHVHVEVLLPGHGALFNAVSLPVRFERELRRALHRGNARKESRSVEFTGNGNVVPNKTTLPRSSGGLFEPAQSIGLFERPSDLRIRAPKAGASPWGRVPRAFPEPSRRSDGGGFQGSEVLLRWRR